MPEIDHPGLTSGITVTLADGRYFVAAPTTVCSNSASWRKIPALARRIECGGALRLATTARG